MRKTLNNCLSEGERIIIVSDPKTYLVFKTGEGGELHCQAGGQLLANQRIFDWLDKTFSA